MWSDKEEIPSKDGSATLRKGNNCERKARGDEDNTHRIERGAKMDL